MYQIFTVGDLGESPRVVLPEVAASVDIAVGPSVSTIDVGSSELFVEREGCWGNGDSTLILSKDDHITCMIKIRHSGVHLERSEAPDTAALNPCAFKVNFLGVPLACADSGR